MNIDFLREYIEFSKVLNFTVAARELHVTQPALSNHIKALEKETGAVLVDRSSEGRSRLTVAGQRFLEMARQIIGVYDERMEEIRACAKRTEGRVSVRLPRAEFSEAFLAHVQEFQRENPQIEVLLKPWVEEDGIEDILSPSVDFAYIGSVDEGEQNGVTFVPFDETEPIIWVDERLPMAHVGLIDPTDANGMRVVIPSNMKNRSWRLSVETIQRKMGVTFAVDERYCDSMEDFFANRIQQDDICVINTGLERFPPISFRRERAKVKFSTKPRVPVSMAYLTEEATPSVRLFADFLSEKFKHRQIRADDERTLL